jgi:hypothetical protein
MERLNLNVVDERRIGKCEFLTFLSDVFFVLCLKVISLAQSFFRAGGFDDFDFLWHEKWKALPASRVLADSKKTFFLVADDI